ncbi:MAG: DUF6495 family protein [Chitinophagales bacterium]
MKFRLLSFEELQSLDKEFMGFLSKRSIAPEEWAHIRIKKQERALELIEAFSEQVFDQVLTKVEYLELREEKKYRQLYFKDNTYIEVGLTADPKTDMDFRDPEQLKDFINSVQKSLAAKLSVFRKEEKYEKTRNEEVFIYVEAGAKRSDEKSFGLMEMLYKESRAIQN